MENSKDPDEAMMRLQMLVVAMKHLSLLAGG